MYNKIISDLVKQNERAEVLQILSQTPEYLSYAGDYRDEENFLLELIKKNSKAMPFIKESFLDNANFINKATRRYTWAAKYASSRLKDDPEFIRDSFARGSRANNVTVKCASVRLLDDAKFVRRMALGHISIIASASRRLKYDRKFNLKLIQANYDIFPHIARQFRENAEFVLESIGYGVQDISKIGKNLLNNKDFILRAVQAGLICLPDGIDSVLMEDEDFIRQLIRNGLRKIPAAYPLKTKEFLEYLDFNNIDYYYGSIESSLFCDAAVLELLVNRLSYQTLTILNDKDFLLRKLDVDTYYLRNFCMKNNIPMTDIYLLRRIVRYWSENMTKLAVELQQYAATRKAKIDELNITCFDRHGDWLPYLVGQRFKLANKQLDPHKPVIVIWQGKADHNGALKNFRQFYAELVKKNQVLFFEIDSLLDIDQSLLLLQTHLPKTIEQRTLIIDAHSRQERILLGQETLTPNLLEDVYGEILTKLNINKLILNSCSTGLGKENEPNLANVFGRYIKTVFAPITGTSVDVMKLDSTGEIVDVEYMPNWCEEALNIEECIEETEKQFQSASGDLKKELLDKLSKLKYEQAQYAIIENPVYKIDSSEDIPYYDSDDFLNSLSRVNCITTQPY